MEVLIYTPRGVQKAVIDDFLTKEEIEKEVRRISNIVRTVKQNNNGKVEYINDN